MKTRRIIKLLFLLVCLTAIVYYLLAERLTAPTPIYRIYLPIVMGGSPARGVGIATCGTYADVAQLNVTWYYNWQLWLPDGAPQNDSRFVVMIQHRHGMAELERAVQTAQQTSDWLLGFNEPDRPEQSNISPSEAAGFWRAIEATGVRLVSPAASQHNPNWLWQMVNEYQKRYGEKPRFDAIAWHIYTSDPNVAKRYLIQRREEALAYGYDAPFWITEWGGNCTQPDPQNGNRRMMNEMIPWMENQKWIARYAWFASCIRPNEPWGTGWHHCSLIDADTRELTPLGELYRRY